MESLEESNCLSLSDSFSLYERYMRSFNVVNNFGNNLENRSPSECDNESFASGGNIDLINARESNACEKSNLDFNKTQSLQLIDSVDKALDSDLLKIGSPCTSTAASLLESSSLTENCINDKSDLTDVRVSSEESKSQDFKPVFITSTMENSNNAVDSVPMFRDEKGTENVFKLPITELSFNATILKHVQKLTPIVDPITALATANNALNLGENSFSGISSNKNSQNYNTMTDSDDRNTSESVKNDKLSEISENSHSEESSMKKLQQSDSSTKWNMDHSYSSLEGSFDSGVRSPDMFSDGDEEVNPVAEPFWSFLDDYEKYDKKRVRKIEERLHGVLPPPSVTILKTDVTQMLKKYYANLPFFNGEENVNMETNSMTPKKNVSFVKIPITKDPCEETEKTRIFDHEVSKTPNDIEYATNNSFNDKSIEIKMVTEIEAKQTAWPDILKCKYYDVYYNLTSHSENIERLNQKYAERFVGAETDSSVSVYSGGLQSPSSASKRKALRLKMAQAKSPGRRLSHLARRRQAFCSAATISERAQCSTSKMVLIDKNFFPHRKLINSAERKSPRTKRTPGKRTPSGKTPGKKTPGKTPKGQTGSSRKKAMRRLLLDNESLSKTQPAREPLKRALFISPENRKAVPVASTSSVPHQVMRSKRNLFGSPVRQEETKSMDGTISDQFLKRKRDLSDEGPENRSKIAKSLSFGGDSLNLSQSQPISMNRRASDMSTSRKIMAELNETHKKKLLWAVTEALRLHGWKMSSPGFKEKASLLARLTRRLLTLPPHAAKLAAPKLSTSDTMFKLARQYVFPIIQGRTVDECFQDEQIKLSQDNTKISGYISASAYQQLRSKQVPATITSQIKENTYDRSKLDQPRSTTKNVLQDKLVNIDSSSNSSSGFSNLDRADIFKSNSMPSFEEAAKMRARRQITFDNVDFSKR